MQSHNEDILGYFRVKDIDYQKVNELITLWIVKLTSLCCQQEYVSWKEKIDKNLV